MTWGDRARQVVRGPGNAVAARLRLDRGPRRLQAYVEQAQVARARELVAGGKYDRAQDLLRPHVDRPVASRDALAALALLHKRAQETGRTVTGATAGNDTPGAFEARLEQYSAAVGLRDPDRIAAALPALISVRPPSREAAVEAFGALRHGTDEDVDEYQRRLLAWRVFTKEKQLAELHDDARAEVELLAASEDELAAVASAVHERMSNPLPYVARCLDERRAWSVLADYVDQHPPGAVENSTQRSGAVELRQAARRAVKAGYTRSAERLATHSLTLRPDDHYAQQTLARARDELMIGREGWSAPAPAAQPAYEPRPRAVLAMLGQSLPHMSGGYATRSHGLLTGLAGHGWDVEAVTRLGFPYDRWAKIDPRRVEDVDEVDGIRYHRVIDGIVPGPYPDYPLATYIDGYAEAVVEHARRHRPAILQASSFPVNGLATRKAAAELGLPYVYEMRGLEDLLRHAVDPAFDATDRRKFLDATEMAACAGAERVFVITEALRREMASRGVPEEKLVVLPNGVHPQLFQPRERDEELAAELGVTGKTVIGYAGGLVHYEGLELLLQAAAELRDRRGGPGADFHLVVVGSGPWERRVHDEAARLHLVDEVVTFTGRVPHEEVGRYLSLFDIAPFPRLPLRVCELISPIKPFESMAMGKAVIVSSVAALTEIVQDEVTGLVFEKGSSSDLARVIGRYLDDPELRSALGAAARSWVLAERDWNKLVDVVSREYEVILGS
ncbi:MAG: glycosyltransferase family 4 protein [Marmoricola sp.]